MEEKKNLRILYKQIRDNINKSDDNSAAVKLLNNPLYKSAKTVFCYVSSGSEVSTELILEDALKSGKTLLVPKCLDKNGNMAAVEIKSLSELKKGFFGIREPEKTDGFDPKKIDFACIPGLAFDKNGYRLGYGKGYYDRFLKECNAYTIGLCYKELFVDVLPYDNYDIPVKDVITE